LEAAGKVSSGAWAELLQTVRGTLDPDELGAALCLNAANPALNSLAAGARRGGDTVVRAAARLVYVQALLAAQQPLTAQESRLFRDAVRLLVSASLDGDRGKV
jgi:hypothetical protein